jgi:hypothetical protein
MVPNAYHAYFGGCASVAGTLIGLLFVAISVSPHKDIGRKAPLSFQVQAGVAFTTLMNTLVVALVALLPGNSLGAGAVILAFTGISATIGMAALSLRHWPPGRDLWGLLIIPALGVLYVLQLLNGLDMLRRPSDPSAVHFQALLVIVFFVIAIARAWQMIGARGTRLLAMVADLLQERSATSDPATADEDSGSVVAATEDPAGGGCSVRRTTSRPHGPTPRTVGFRNQTLVRSPSTRHGFTERRATSGYGGWLERMARWLAHPKGRNVSHFRGSGAQALEGTSRALSAGP